MRLSYDEQISNIDGFEKLGDFCFYDSIVTNFSYENKNLFMKFEYDKGVTVQLRFEGIYEIMIDADPPATCWINTFSCYREFRNKDIILFNIGFYQILCSKIIVVSD